MKIKEYQNKTILKGMNLAQIEDWCKENGHSSYRAKQIYQWMYKHGVDSAEDMNNISKKLRDDIESHYILKTLDVEKIDKSKSEPTQKILFKTRDNHFIEAVSMVDDSRHTICLSSQIGCNVDCSFCATATMGLIRNLLPGEIIDQAITIRHLVKEPITNVVFMGLGEPFLNYDRVLEAADILHSHDGFGLGAKRITISTAGIVLKIDRFIKENRKYKLAISLNATQNETRQKIMPLNRNWPIEDIIKSAAVFAARKNHNVMFEYVLLKDINDTPEDAKRLAKLIQGIDCKVNVIPYNETDGNIKDPLMKRLNHS